MLRADARGLAPWLSPWLPARPTVEHYLRPGTLQLAALPPLSLYVHLPWCLKKCPYCDFNSHEVAASGACPKQRYLDALRRRPRSGAAAGVGPAGRTASSSAAARPACSRPTASTALLADMRARLPLEPGCEITLEANPGTFERERFRAFRAAGVTRLSVGVQSFDDAMLQAHRPRARRRAGARRGAKRRASAFDTFNLDLMYALPGQTLRQLQRRPRHGAGVRAAAPVGLPPDDRAEHAASRTHPPRAARRRPGVSDMLDAIVAAHRRRGPGALRGVGLRASRATAACTT